MTRSRESRRRAGVCFEAGQIRFASAEGAVEAEAGTETGTAVVGKRC